MMSLYADPLYVTLCRRQDTFRARLTPKPWRSELTYLEENDDYLNKDMDDFYPEAVCELIAQYGVKKPIPEFTDLIKYHDTVTKSVSDYRSSKLSYKLT